MTERTRPTEQVAPHAVRFRLKHWVRPFYVDWERSGPLVFRYGAADKVSVAIRKVNDDERAFDYDTNPAARDDAVCIAETTVTPPTAIYRMLLVLAQGELPEGSQQIAIPNLLMALPNAPDDLHLNHLPRPLTKFGQELYDLLRDLSQRTVNVLRWRIGIPGPHMPLLGYPPLEWSLDGKEWHWQRNDPQMRHESIPMHGTTSDLLADVQSIVIEGEDEPLAHALWREAWEQRRQNPRSTLVIGMAAAEVGMKKCIGLLVPDAEWLATNAPTPPLVQMVARYLPTLPAKLQIGGKVVPPPQKVRKALDDGVRQRNRTVHAGAKPPSSLELETILLAVRDLLWMLDYYCGAAWALENLQAQTRHDLGLPFHFGLRGPRQLFGAR